MFEAINEQSITEEFNPLCERSVLKRIFTLAVIVNEHLGEVQLLPESV